MASAWACAARRPDCGLRRLLRAGHAAGQAGRGAGAHRDHRDAAESACGRPTPMCMPSPPMTRPSRRPPPCWPTASGRSAAAIAPRMTQDQRRAGALRDELTREYTLTIVSRPGESTGVWRRPPGRQPGAQLLPDRRADRAGWPQAQHSDPQRGDRRTRDRRQVRRARAASNVRDGRPGQARRRHRPEATGSA